MADMIVCRQCGVELEPGMEVCPLCEIAVADGKPIPVKPSYRDFADVSFRTNIPCDYFIDKFFVRLQLHNVMYCL